MSAAVRLYRRLLNLLQPEYWMMRRFIGETLADPVATLPVLDIGGGRAPHAATLARARPRAAQIVIDLAAAPELTLVADAACLPLGPAAAGAVALFHVLQHVEDPAHVLAEMHRVLAPGGLMLMAYPSIQPEGRSRDLWRWTRAGAERVVAKAGFDVVDHRPVGGFFFLVTATLAGLPGRLLIRHVAGWRSGRTFGDHLRIGLALALAAPWHLLGYPALLLDRLTPGGAYQTGGMMLARRREHG